MKRSTLLLSFLAFLFALVIFFRFTRFAPHPIVTTTPSLTPSQTIQSQPAMYQPLQLSSPAFSDGGMIPADYTCKGEGSSPPIEIKNVPQQAASLALIVRDPDAPSGDFIHWIAWNIKSDVAEIDSKKILIGATEGVSSAGTKGWTPLCPPSGTHRYFFTVYAVNSLLQLSASSTVTDLEGALKGHVIGQAQIIGKVSH